jgi:hypothetical protein
MLLQLVVQHPQALEPILRHTLVWVWGLLATLLALGLSQVRARRISQLRVVLLPLSMSGMSLWGTGSAFGNSPLFGYVLLAWAAGAALMLGLIAPQAPAVGTRYHAASRSFALPGSWLPLLLILGVFLIKYVVGVELAMQPTLARDGQYTLIVGGLYGLFSGAFAGRAARLWRLAQRPAAISATPTLNA